MNYFRVSHLLFFICLFLFPLVAEAKWPDRSFPERGNTTSGDLPYRLGAPPSKAGRSAILWDGQGCDDLNSHQDSLEVLPPQKSLRGTVGQPPVDKGQYALLDTPTMTPETSPGGDRSKALPVGWLPSGHLFRSLLADPRWLHFSASYHYYLEGEEARHVGAVSLGEVIPLYRLQGPLDGQFELGVQAGVFAIFDLEAESHDLINADYWVALHSVYRRGDIAAMGRVYHRSSHLGDEFLMRGSVERIDLSLEAVDLRLAYELPHGLRLYGGGGFIFNQKDTDLDPWSTQVGVEFRSPWAAWNGHLRPIGGLDIQNHQQNDWGSDLSLRAGLQFESIVVLERSLQLLFHYYNGYAPDGQFYNEKIRYVGLGIHLYF